MGRRSRALSYILVAVIAFGLGASRPAFAETGGLPQLTAQVQTLVTGLAAEVTRAMGAESTLSASQANLTAGLNAEITRAKSAEGGLFAQVQAGKDTIDQLHAAIITMSLGASAETAAREHADSDLRSMFDELKAASQDALHTGDLEAVKQGLRSAIDAAVGHEAELRALADDENADEIAAEHDRATAAEDREAAARLLAEAEAAEQRAADLERATTAIENEASARLQGDADTLAAAISATRLTSIDQLGGLKCTTADKQPGHTVFAIGPDGTITLRCVANAQP